MKKRMISLLLAIVMVAGLLPTVAFASESTPVSEITGIAIIVDGVTYTEGEVIITPDSEITFTFYGNNLEQKSEGAIIDTPITYVRLKGASAGANGEFSCQAYPAWFEGAQNYPIAYTSDNWLTTQESGIYVTYVGSNPSVPAQISGLAITVDGVTYTEGNVIVKPESTVSFTVFGENLSDGNLDCVIDTPLAYLPLHSMPLNEAGAYIYPTVASIFQGAVNYPITYTNDQWGTRQESGIFVTYDDGTVPAQITGVTVTVDGVSYAQGDLVITPDTQFLVFTVNGTNFTNLSENNLLRYTQNNTEPLTGFVVDTEVNTATLNQSGNISMFADCDHFQIQYSNDGGATMIDTGISLTYEVPAPEIPELKITLQPTDTETIMGERFCVEVQAQGEGLSYQWYFKNEGANRFSKSSVTDNTYDDVMTKARMNRQIYCVITDAYGNSVTTDTVTLAAAHGETLEIVTQPSSQSVLMGEMFNVVFEAKGDGLKYQWYFRKAGTEKWKTSSQRDNSYDDVMTAARHNRELYCVVTDGWGNSVQTDPIVIIMALPTQQLAITAQPNDASAKLGEEFCVTVEAQGDGLKYRWYFRKAGTEQWKNSSVRDNTYDDIMTSARHDREVYCVITDMWGNSVTSEIATIRGISTQELTIVQQPVDSETGMGEMFNVEVLAQGDGLTYQWYFCNEGDSKWRKSSVRDNTYDDVMTMTRAGRQIYCVITDAWGNTVQTDVVTLNATD